MVSSTVMYVVAALLLAAGAAFIYLIVRSNTSRRPEGAIEWAAVVLSSLVIASAMGLGATTYLSETGVSLSGEDGRVIGTNAPPFRFRMVDSNEQKALEDYEGKVVLLNLWATWCPPCLGEIPELNRFQKEFGPKGVEVVTISDEPREAIQDFEKNKMHLQTVNAYLPDDFPMPAPYDRVKSSRPTTFVIDRQGIIRDVWAGAEDYEHFRQVVQPYL